MTTNAGTVGEFRPLNVVATHESGVLRRNHEWLKDEANAQAIARQIAPGFEPDAEYDMSYFGGPTMQTATVMPLYVGGDGSGSGGATQWSQSDITSIGDALTKALGDKNLESVIAQYFAAEPTCTVAAGGSITNASANVTQSDIETLVQNEYAAGTLTGDVSTTLYCFLLSAGTELSTSDGTSSLNGLGGFHGSVSVTDNSGAQHTLYYAVGVYSETSNGVTNGIPAFPEPWKSVVATFYHEINEWRTDADVEKAQGSNVNGILGWYSQQYGEIGDIPITEAGSNLSEVFVEAELAAGSGTVPVQLMYSNFDHGPAAVTSAQPSAPQVQSGQFKAED